MAEKIFRSINWHRRRINFWRTWTNYTETKGWYRDSKDWNWRKKCSTTSTLYLRLHKWLTKYGRNRPRSMAEIALLYGSNRRPRSTTSRRETSFEHSRCSLSWQIIYWRSQMKLTSTSESRITGVWRGYFHVESSIWIIWDFLIHIPFSNNLIIIFQ